MDEGDRPAGDDESVDRDEAPTNETEGGTSDPVKRVVADGEDDTAGDRDGQGGDDRLANRDRPESTERSSLLSRFRSDREGALMWIREMLTSVAVVLLVGLLLFGVAGVWPPMVAIESGSMEPNMEVGDLVFVTEPGRLAPDVADSGIGVVTHDRGQEAEYRTFGSYGSVVIYSQPGRSGSPIIHRAMFRVEEGENWYDRADERYHDADNCEELEHCPAPHDGYITLGDNNEYYDQARGLSPPVKDEWVTGVARARVPYLGYVRLLATGQVELNEVIEQTLGSGVPTWQTADLGVVDPAVNGFGVVDSGAVVRPRAG